MTPTLTQTEPSGAPPDELHYEATVSRELVHKHSVHEVLLTDAHQFDDDYYVCAGQLPRTHSFYSDSRMSFATDHVSVSYDPMLLMELQRQAAVLVAHRWHDVSREHRFVFLNIDLAIQRPETLVVGERPARVLMSLRIVDRKYHGDHLIGYTAEATCSLDGAEMCTAKGAVLFMPKRFYEDMRRKQRTARHLEPEPPLHCVDRRFPVPPEVLGRINRSNVVLSGLSASRESGRYEAAVVVDERHPCLFDHRLDHVPGMLQLEAHRQIAVAAASDQLGVVPSRLIATRSASTFESFAELDLTLLCEATVNADDGGGGKIMVTTGLLQDGVRISDGQLGFAVAE